MDMKVLLVIFACVVISQGEDDEALERLSRIKRVIGGSGIAEGDWPHLVHLEGIVKHGWWNSKKTTYYCTGSVINKRWVLTAAHCFYPPNEQNGVRYPRNWHATVGEVNRHNFLNRFWGWITRHPIYYKHVSEIKIYPAFNKLEKWKHDLALVKLEEDLPLSTDRNMAAVSLPSSNSDSWPAVGDSCVMKGWGCTAKGGPQSSTARSVTLPIQPESTCSQRYGYISSYRLCAGAIARNIGICQGDSGGPLVCRDSSGNWKLAGLASFTSATAPSQAPGVFVRISHYLDWIESTAGRLGNY